MDNNRIINKITDIEDMCEIATEYITMHEDKIILRSKLQFCLDVIESATSVIKYELKK